MSYSEDLFRTCRRYWLAGRCPCCGGELTSWPGPLGDVGPAPVAEGVMFCGRCIGNRHYEYPMDFLPLMLRALVEVPE